MKHFANVLFLAALLAAPAAFAQKWEIGGGFGGSFYTSDGVSAPGLSGNASLSDGGAVSVWIGNNSGSLLGGELRYDHEFDNLRLSSGGTSVRFGAQTNAIHYDFLWHFASRESKIRPFVAAGAGVKLYTGTGAEQAFQPLNGLALLSKTTDTKALVSVGGGVKIQLSPAVQLRLDAHDYLTPFPTKTIAPAVGAKLGGWLSDFVVMAGLSFSF